VSHLERSAASLQVGPRAAEISAGTFPLQPPQEDPHRASARYKTRHLLSLFAVITLAVGVANYAVLRRSQSELIEHEALRLAEVVTDQALSSRSVFTTTVADKIKNDGFGIDEDYHLRKGFVPIPAQFLKFVAQEVRRSSGGLYNYRPLSKWNLEPSQGLNDQFQRWAWAQLEAQDQARPQGPIAWRPIWRFEEVNGVPTLRYMRADPAAKQSCVDCHSEREQSAPILARRAAAGVTPGKRWRPHQLLGAVEASIPVDRIEALAAKQANLPLAVVLLISTGGLGAAGGLALRDLKRQRSRAEFFQQQASSDPLTQLGNRAMFVDRARALLALLERQSGQAAILFIDLDRFKPINDQHGHKVGDEVLREIAARLTRSLRQSDLVARQGGDEFLVLLTAPSGVVNSVVVAEKVREAIEAPIVVEGVAHRVGASIGIAHYPEDGADLDTLIERADAAMYHVKKRGRGSHFRWTAGLT